MSGVRNKKAYMMTDILVLDIIQLMGMSGRSCVEE